MSCATQRCTALIESPSVVAPATTWPSFVASTGVTVERSLASPAYQWAMSDQVTAPAASIPAYTVSGSPAYGSRSTRGTSWVIQAYTFRPPTAVTVGRKCRFRSWIRGANDLGMSSTRRDRRVRRLLCTDQLE